MKKSWLSYVNLSDHYERKARFLPAVLSILPLLPLSAAFGAPLMEWVKVLVAGVGLGAILAVALSHVASAAGNRLQEALWPDWPHDAPTNRWLHPEEKSVSTQQKQRWYRTIQSTLGLDIQAAVDAGNAGELKAVINDAVQALRNRLWQAPTAERMRFHNVDYGFARNLTGLRWVWGLFALGSLGGCWSAYIWYGRPIFWAVTSTVVALCAFALAIVLPRYVRRKAHYYAESFFEAGVTLGEKSVKNSTPSEGNQPCQP
jgi:hypothetical protein